MAEPEDLLFSGLKVVDVGTWIAGPVAATILADFGADVVKVEMPGTGDPYRRLPLSPIGPQSDLNFVWIVDGRNKRSITLNLKSTEGRDILLKLVSECDVFVTNQPLPMRRNLRLRYEDLAPLNERMIYASLTPYGETGPDSDLEGFDGVAWWGRTGLMDLVRAQGAPPGGSVPGMGDHPSAVSLYAAIVTALLRRQRTGKGGLVHTSLFANGIWANACYAQAALVGADFAPVKAPRAPGPNRSAFETKDGRLLQLYMVRTMDELDGLLIAAGRIDVLDDPRFGDHAERPNHLAELVDILRPMFLERSAAEWMAIFRENNVPVSLVAEMPDLATDPQVLAAGIVGPPSDPSVPASLILNHPLNVEGLPRVGPTHAPEIGEHTAAVLRELNFTDAEIGAFRSNGVV